MSFKSFPACRSLHSSEAASSCVRLHVERLSRRNIVLEIIRRFSKFWIVVAAQKYSAFLNQSPVS